MMIKFKNNKKKIFKLIFLLISFFYVLGTNLNLVTEKETLGYSNFINVIILILLAFFFLGDSYSLYRYEKEKDEEKQKEAISHFFWSGWVFIAILFFNYYRPSQLSLSFYYLYFTIAFAFFNIYVAFFYLIATVIVQYILLYNAPWQGDIATFIIFTVLTVLFSIFGYMLKREKKKKHSLKKRLENIEEGIKTFFDDEEEKIVLALNEEKRVEKLYNSYNFFEDRVLRILQQIKELMDPYTVAFLKLKNDGKYFVVFEAISDNDYIRHNEDILAEAGIIGWISKHKKSINMGHFKGGVEALNYYDRAVSIKSFLAMPVFWREKLVGVLVVDSLQEEAFAKESENLIKICCNEIQDALENAQLFQQIQQQNQEFAALYHASKKLLTYVSLEDNLNGFLELISTFIKFDVAILCLLDGDVLRVKALRGLKKELIDHEVDKDSLIYWVIKHKQYLDIKRYNEKKRVNPLVDSSVKLPSFERVVIYPFLMENKVIGSYMLGFVKGTLSDYEKNVLEILTNQTSISILNALLFEKVNLMATTDGLTGVYNHRYFQEKLSNEIERARRYNEKLILMILDIDFFKKVNDTYGHPIGDLVLKSVSKCLKSATRKIDIVARYGGEEFAVIMVQTGKEGGVKFAERIRETIMKNEVFFPGGKLSVTASIGLACFPEDGKNNSELIEKADKALYTAKKRGRNMVVAFDSALEKE